MTSHATVAISALFGLIVGALAQAGEPQPVSFDASDGFHLFADYYAPRTNEDGAPLVILLHDCQQDRKVWKDLASKLGDEGFATLAIDLRGHGESRTPETEKRAENRDPRLFRDMYEDVRAAYDWLATQKHVDRSRFAVIGATAGASIALRYAAQDKSVDTLVCLSPVLTSCGLESRRDVAKITGRKVLLVTTADQREDADALKGLTAGAQVKVHEGQRHGTDLFAIVPTLEQEIVRFLKESLGKRTSTIVYGSINSDIYHPADSGWIDRIKATNLRYYSSPEEAQSRGLRLTKSKTPDDVNGKSGGKGRTGGAAGEKRPPKGKDDKGADSKNKGDGDRP